MTPVCVLTGFLGSGKTTLLADWLQLPAFSKTAVIINEFGDVGLDHHLVRTSDESVVQLSTGCVCCMVRDDLLETLHDLHLRRQAGEITCFDRVVIETSGMADPTGICHTLLNQTIGTSNAGEYFLEHIVTTLDSTTAGDQLSRFTESKRQLALADCVVVTKTDLSGQDAIAFARQSGGLNAQAHCFDGAQVRSDPAALFDRPPYDHIDGHGLLGQEFIQEISLDAAQGNAHAHHGINSFTLRLNRPMQAVTLSLLLQALAEHYGARLLRLKGLVNVAQAPGRPAVVHGVQHVLYPIRWLDAWPDGDQQTRLVLIGEGLSQQWIELLLEAIEAEVKAVVI